jgi:hypothetical protein
MDTTTGDGGVESAISMVDNTLHPELLESRGRTDDERREHPMLGRPVTYAEMCGKYSTFEGFGNVTEEQKLMHWSNLMPEVEHSDRREIASGMFDWRKLPTAWLHFPLMECAHLLASCYAWRSLLSTINTTCAMNKFFEESWRMQNYFTTLFFLGKVSSVNFTLPNVTDDFFVNSGERILFTGSSLILPSTSVQGSNFVWLLLAWTLPFGAGMLVLTYVYTFLGKCLWSFESFEYLEFTLNVYKTRKYKCCIGIMFIGPIVLPLLWIAQIIVYQLADQTLAFQRCTLHGILLVWGLTGLWDPHFPQHEWRAWMEDFNEAGIQLRRPLLHLLLSSNKTFVLRLNDAFSSAQHGDLGRLRRYLRDPSQASHALQIWMKLQRCETERKRQKIRDRESERPAER